MTILDNVNSISEIQNKFTLITQKLTDYSHQFSDEIFFAPFGEKWSMGENVGHLILTNGAITKTLSYPKEKLTERFGQSNRPSMKGPVIIETYLNQLKKTPIKAPAGYTPDNKIETSKEAILKSWADVNLAFHHNLKNWTEADLDNCQVPHPLLGNMNVRELVLFSVYHVEHHLKAMERIAAANA